MGYLGELYDEAKEEEETLTFGDFLDRIRDQYDLRKLDDDIIIEPTGIMIPTKMSIEMCPEDVKDLRTTLVAFNDLLEDCLSYSSWLNA